MVKAVSFLIKAFPGSVLFETLWFFEITEQTVIKMNLVLFLLSLNSLIEELRLQGILISAAFFADQSYNSICPIPVVFGPVHTIKHLQGLKRGRDNSE